jgi:holo-[acyl-carrier protein] synthase
MAIYSTGVDLAEIDRIERVLHEYGDRFTKRVFTPHEIAYCSRKATAASSYAARFATKEAVFKATGIGLSMGMRWRDVEVVNDMRGKPSVRLYGVAAERLQGKKVHLSISHSRNLAIAMIVVEQD